MPFGIQIRGKRRVDARVLQVAAALDAQLQTIPGLARPVPDLAALTRPG